MSQRVVTFTNPANTNYQNLYTQMLSITGAVPAFGILPDRVSWLGIYSSGAGLVGDSNSANSAGAPVSSTAPLIMSSVANDISLKDFYLSGNAVTFTIVIKWGQ